MTKPNETLDILELVESAYLHGLPVENVDTGELEPPADIADVKWIAERINTYYSQLVVDARFDELFLACKQWEKDPSKPATYLINRKQQLGLE